MSADVPHGITDPTDETTEDYDAADWYGPETATFGDRVTGAREAAGLSRDELAARMGIRLDTLVAWEEDMAEPRGNKLQMLSGVTGVSIPWLLTGAGEGPGAPGAAGSGRGGLGPALGPVLAELRGLRAEMTGLAARLGRLEAQLVALDGETE
ncbi:helix-turn-helix domain-containing protein [Frigidibacter sp. MR17.24]|uniref:helix-turn-helix domain-containing protein n=1 Tax=Frigidibacter sp. MR17.24 TaxID=3127345 RepID=UPI003012D227